MSAPSLARRIRQMAIYSFIAFCAMIFAPNTASPDGSIRISPIPLQPGLHLSFESQTRVHPLQPRIKEDFDIDIRETWPAGVTFQYTTQQSVLGSQTGMQTLNAMDTCTSIDPWWDPDKSEHSDFCEFWIPRSVFNALIVNKQAWLSIDTLARRDAAVRWTWIAQTAYPCIINDRPVSLKAFSVTTTRNDEIIILDDPNNPLILSIDSEYFAWKLISANY